MFIHSLRSLVRFEEVRHQLGVGWEPLLSIHLQLRIFLRNITENKSCTTNDVKVLNWLIQFLKPAIKTAVFKYKYQTNFLLEATHVQQSHNIFK